MGSRRSCQTEQPKTDVQREGSSASHKEKIKKTAKKKGSSPQASTYGLAMASFGCGLVGLLGFIFLPLGLAFSIMGIIFGLSALNRMSYEPDQRRGKGLAIAGLALSSLTILGLVALVLALIYG